MHIYDYLIIGSGIAGLSAALKAPPSAKVCVLTKGAGHEGSSNHAQGGIASAIAPTDSIDLHVQDTLVAGAGLCRSEPVQILAKTGPETIRLLIEWGVQFTRQKENPQEWFPYHLALEGGHSHRRIFHATDLTGKEIMRAMLEEAHKAPNITILESHLAVDLLVQEEHCYGALVFNRNTQESEVFQAKVTVLATGGVGKCFKHTTNPSVSTGDGVAMAYRAGAIVEDMEFVQFHPTSLYGSDGFLISEAVRGHGGILRNHKGDAFMENAHERKDLAPRDIVARAIDKEMKTHNLSHVFLDITHLPAEDIRFHFPNIYRKCLEFGIDITKEYIPVVPAAHYMCGGIKVNEVSESNIEALYAVGECSCTGVHGANRLASNSLLESVVFSIHAMKDSVRYLCTTIPESENPHLQNEPDSQWKSVQKEIQSLLWKKVGIVRSNDSLSIALQELDALWDKIQKAWDERIICEDLLHTRNICQCAKLIVIAALQRHESRGLHYSLDYPETLDSEKKHNSFQK